MVEKKRHFDVVINIMETLHERLIYPKTENVSLQTYKGNYQISLQIHAILSEPHTNAMMSLEQQKTYVSL